MNKAQKAAKSVYRGSGPYRRVWSKTGYVGVEAVIRLPAAGAMHIIASDLFEDIAYTYAGGWGEKGHAVDAGLQHSRQFDNWTVVVLTEGEKEMLTALPRFGSGQVVRMRFEVVGPNQLRLTAESEDGLGPRIIEWEAKGEAGDWGRSAKQVFKRMVSVAQVKIVNGKKKKTDRFDSGSIAGPIRWEDVRLIKADGSLVPWTSGHAGSHNYPSEAPHDQHFKFVWSNFNAETVTIDLT